MPCCIVDAIKEQTKASLSILFQKKIRGFKIRFFLSFCAPVPQPSVIHGHVIRASISGWKHIYMQSHKMEQECYMYVYSAQQHILWEKEAKTIELRCKTTRPEL